MRLCTGSRRSYEVVRVVHDAPARRGLEDGDLSGVQVQDNQSLCCGCLPDLLVLVCAGVLVCSGSGTSQPPQPIPDP